MAEDDALPQPDKLEGAPHPIDTARLFGQSDAVATFLEAYDSGRLHSGWLITGPKGIGKATLAWKLAGFLLADPGPSPLPPTDRITLPADAPDMRLLQAGAHPRLFVIRRPYDQKTKTLKKVITVDAVRELRGFFAMSAADGGRRVVIVDAADDMNVSAANALLKELEEPPENTTLLLLAHRPGAILPTIRSRCRVLRVEPLPKPLFANALEQAGFGEGDMDMLYHLSAGAPGRAIEIEHQGGSDIYGKLLAIFAQAGGYNAAAASHLAGSVTGAAKAERNAVANQLLNVFVARSARAAAGLPLEPVNPTEAHWHQSLRGKAQDWAALHAEITQKARQAQAVNIDPETTLLTLLARIKSVAFSS